MVSSASDGPTPDWPDNVDIAMDDAAKDGDLQRIKQLLDGGAPVDGSGALAMTPLMKAIWSDQPDAAKLLVSRGADVHYANAIGQNAFSVAADKKDPAYLELLFEHSDTTRLEFVDSYNPLFIAAKSNRARHIRLCLAGGMDANRKDETEWTALHHAYVHDAKHALRALLDNGARAQPEFLAFAGLMRTQGKDESYDLILRHLEKQAAGQTVRRSRVKRRKTAGFRL